MLIIIIMRDVYASEYRTRIPIPHVQTFKVSGAINCLFVKMKKIFLQPGASLQNQDENIHLLDGKIVANYTSQSNDPSQIELQDLYLKLPVADVENGCSDVNKNERSQPASDGIFKKLLNVIIICVLIGTLYGVGYMHWQQSIMPPSIPSGISSDPDVYSYQDPLNSYRQDDDYAVATEPREHFRKNSSGLQIGLIGFEGVSIDRINMRKTKESSGKERLSIIKNYVCYLDGEENSPLAKGTIEKNAAGQGWTTLIVQSTMDPFVHTLNDSTRSPHSYSNQGSGSSGAAPVTPPSPGETFYPDSRRLTKNGTPETMVDSKHNKTELAVQWLRTRMGMGFFEGYTTCLEVRDWYANSYQAQFDGGDPNEAILRFLESNHDWMVRQANLHWRSSDYWLSIKGRLAQLHGLLAGVRAGCPGTNEPRGKTFFVQPASGIETVQEIDGHRDWIGQASAGNDYTYYYNNMSPRSNADGIYLADMDRTPALIHLLILNANGDLYQIGDKFNIFADRPKKTDGRKKDRKRIENKKYMLKNHTVHDDDDDAADDDGDFSKNKWGRETLETVGGMDTATKTDRSVHSSRYRRASEVFNKQSLANMPIDVSDDEKHTSGRAYNEILEQYYLADHCSALIKLLPNNSDVVFGHNTWDDYQNAFPRIFKTYEYPVMKNSLPAGQHRIDFSSSPGLLASIDDFYIVKGSNGANMAVMETSIDLYNRTYLSYVKHESVLAWVRVMTANELAADGPKWANRFSEYASGTYMDQWMIIDFNKFEVGHDPRSGFLIVLEEMPGRVHWEDKTEHIIDTSYWASYNNPYFTDIRDMSGQTALCIKNSLECYSTDPRAQIFHVLQKNLSTLSDFRTVMQYNHWQTDPLSMKNSCRSIACRADLETDLALWGPHGAVDAKMSSYLLSSSPIEAHITPVVFAILGPTHDSQPPFCWSQFTEVTDMAGHDVQHRGHPSCFKYEWLVVPRETSNQRLGEYW